MTLEPSSSARGRFSARCRVPSPLVSLTVTAGAVVLLALAVASPAAADDCGPHVPRLRPVDRSSGEVIADGCKRSPTFKHLVDEIEQTDLFVYIEASREVPKTMHAFMQLAGASGRYRYLRIVLRLPASTDALIAQLGHELQHITEVGHASDVRDQPAMEALYRKIGEESGAGWDTAAARAVGRQVLEELRHNANAVPADPPPIVGPHAK